ncbi:hypothetical protein AB0L99_45185 [Streptomyces sp. NPDC051954]|uniref:hypothetical protein n=1 Tax=Streptomyces sp. NPDC051954 TaxID=3155524 RepID=UPI0034219957
MRIRRALTTAALSTTLAVGILAAPAEATGQPAAPPTTTAPVGTSGAAGAADYPDYEFWATSKGAYLRTNYFGSADPVRWSPQGEELWVFSVDINPYHNRWAWVRDAWGTRAWIYCDNITPRC